MVTRILATAARKGPFTKMREDGRNSALNQLTCLAAFLLFGKAYTALGGQRYRKCRHKKGLIGLIFRESTAED